MCPTELLDSPEVETPEVEAPEAPEAPAPESSEPELESGDGEGAPTTEPEEPAYQPNFKYRVMDNEKEIPEKFRSLIKSPEDEKELRELFEKADGLEFAKPKHEALQQTFNQVQAEHNYLLGHVQEARAAYQRGDLDGFFEKLAIPQEKILRYALEKVQYEELPPEQKMLIDARRQAERQNMQLQSQQQTQARQFQEQFRQAHQAVLASELARPEIKSMADAFDQRAGRPGSFLAEVNNRGQLAWFQSQGKTVLTPGQAIEQVISLYGLKPQAPQGQEQPKVVPPASGGNREKANTIPNVGGGRSSAPVKQKPRSIEDLKKMRQAMIQNEAG